MIKQSLILIRIITIILITIIILIAVILILFYRANQIFLAARIIAVIAIVILL